MLRTMNSVKGRLLEKQVLIELFAVYPIVICHFLFVSTEVSHHFGIHSSRQLRVKTTCYM